MCMFFEFKRDVRGFLRVSARLQEVNARELANERIYCRVVAACGLLL
jgi:hypothetical protein